MINDDTFNKIEAWLSGELPEAEARAFEAEMASVTVLATEVERHRRGREALDRLAEQALQVDMARWRESLDELPEPPSDAPPATGTAKWPRRLLGGLFGVLLLGVAYWFWPSEKVQPGILPQEKTVPPTTNPNVPIADTPADEPANENKDPQQMRERKSPQLIAMAETNLRDFRGAILNNYKDQRGDDDEENPTFTAGLKAFQKGDAKAAKANLLQVPIGNNYFSSAQEMLALLYFREKDYKKAALSYESYAINNSDPAKDWRLLQFYLADYQNSRADFWKKMDEMTQPGYQPLNYRKEAINLKSELGKLGVK